MRQHRNLAREDRQDVLAQNEPVKSHSLHSPRANVGLGLRRPTTLTDVLHMATSDAMTDIRDRKLRSHGFHLRSVQVMSGTD